MHGSRTVTCGASSTVAPVHHRTALSSLFRGVGFLANGDIVFVVIDFDFFFFVVIINLKFRPSLCCYVLFLL